MVPKKIADKLADNGVEDDEEVMVIDNEALVDSMIGITSDRRVVYDFDMMVEDFVKAYGWDGIDAIEFIEYNIIRALPYYKDKAPIVFYPFE